VDEVLSRSTRIRDVRRRVEVQGGVGAPDRRGRTRPLGCTTTSG